MPRTFSSKSYLGAPCLHKEAWNWTRWCRQSIATGSRSRDPPGGCNWGYGSRVYPSSLWVLPPNNYKENHGYIMVVHHWHRALTHSHGWMSHCVTRSPIPFPRGHSIPDPSLWHCIPKSNVSSLTTPPSYAAPLQSVSYLYALSAAHLDNAGPNKFLKHLVYIA